MSRDIGRTRPPRRVPTIYRTAYLALLALWICMPFLVRSNLAQDALPYLTAGRLTRTEPHAIYSLDPSRTVTPEFERAWCRLAPRGTDCPHRATAFVASPAALPVASLLSKLGTDLGILTMRVAAAAMLAGGMWVLWKRLAHRSRHAPLLLIASAFVLFPVVSNPVVLAQTSPIMFLSVCLGMGTDRLGSGLRAGVTWAAAVALKATPVALIVLLLHHRRWRALCTAAVTLALLAIGVSILAPASIWVDFARSTLHLGSNVSEVKANRSLTVMITRLVGHGSSASAEWIGRIVSLSAAASVCWFGLRNTKGTTRWAIGFIAILVASPLVWWHYVWVPFGALGIVLADQRRLDNRLMAMIPLSALLMVAPSMTNVDTPPWPIVQEAVFAMLVVTVCVLARRSAREWSTTA